MWNMGNVFIELLRNGNSFAKTFNLVVCASVMVATVCVCVVYHRLDSASYKNFVVVAKHTNAAARSKVYRLPWSIRVDLKLMKVPFDLRLFDILRRFSNGKLTIESMGQLNLVNCSHKTFQLPHFDNNFQLLCDNWITLNYTKISMRARKHTLNGLGLCSIETGHANSSHVGKQSLLKLFV